MKKENSMRFILLGLLITPSFLNSQTVKSNPDTLFVVSAQELPEPVGGIRAIQQNVTYPESARKDSIEGTVYLEAFIDKAGNVARTAIVKGVRADVDEAAQVAVARVQFRPGKVNGEPVNVRIAIPIRFKLSASVMLSKKSEVNKPTVFILQGPLDLKEDIQYPAIAVRAGIEGTVFATVGLDQDHKIKQLTINKGIGAGCDEQVLRALTSPRFARYASKEKGAGNLKVVVEFVLPSVVESTPRK